MSSFSVKIQNDPIKTKDGVVYFLNWLVGSLGV